MRVDQRWWLAGASPMCTRWWPAGDREPVTVASTIDLPTTISETHTAESSQCSKTGVDAMTAPTACGYDVHSTYTTTSTTSRQQSSGTSQKKTKGEQYDHTERHDETKATYNVVRHNAAWTTQRHTLWRCREISTCPSTKPRRMSQQPFFILTNQAHARCICGGATVVTIISS